MEMSSDDCADVFLCYGGHNPSVRFGSEFVFNQASGLSRVRGDDERDDWFLAGQEQAADAGTFRSRAGAPIGRAAGTGTLHRQTSREFRGASTPGQVGKAQNFSPPRDAGGRGYRKGQVMFARRETVETVEDCPRRPITQLKLGVNE